MANCGALFPAAKPTLQLINVSANYAEHSSCPLTWFYFLSLILLFYQRRRGSTRAGHLGVNADVCEASLAAQRSFRQLVLWLCGDVNCHRQMEPRDPRELRCPGMPRGQETSKKPAGGPKPKACHRQKEGQSGQL